MSAGGSPDLPCSAHAALPAAALCALCLRPYAGRFLSPLPDGRACCSTCADREGLHVIDSPHGSADADPVLAGGWGSTFRRVVVEPHRGLVVEHDGPIGPALRAGFAFTVVGYLIRTAWDYVLQYDAVMAMLAEQVGPGVPEATLSLTPWLAVPIAAVFRLVGGSLLLHLGLRLTGIGPGTLRPHARIFALTSVTLLLCVIPVIGPLLALVAWMSSTLAWTRRRYGLPTWRALAATLPALLLVTSLDPSLSSLATAG